MDRDHYSYLDGIQTVVSNGCAIVAYVKTRVDQFRAFTHERQFSGQTDGSSFAEGYSMAALERNL